VPRLLAAERVAARPHRLHDVPIADRRAHDLAPCAASARSSPRLLITVATIVFPGSFPIRSMRSAHSAMTASPSTISPFSSTMITRSASPSSAMPMWASFLRTSAACARGAAPRRVAVDVLAVRLHAERRHVPAELREHRGRHAVGRAVRRVDDDAQPVEVEAGSGTSSCRTRRSAPPRRRSSRPCRCARP
jgi:hypothetical protein